MKKYIGIFSLALLLASCTSTSLTKTADIKKANDYSAINSAFCSFFNDDFQASTIMTNTYNGVTLTILDQVSDSAKTTILYEDGQAISTQFIVENSSGIAVESYLDISNTVQTRSLSSSLAFDGNYGSPLSAVTSDSTKLETYFTITEAEDGYDYTATATGISMLTQAFNSFFEFYQDSYTWDSKTQQDLLSSLTIHTSSTGTPETMDFIKTRKDHFGAMKVGYASTLSTIAEGELLTLEPDTFNGSDEALTALETSLDLLATNLSSGNFRQDVTLPNSDLVSGGYSNYSNYYQFTTDSDGGIYGAMLQNIPYEASTYGKTYIGLAVDSDGEIYQAGSSPESDVIGATGSDTFTSVSEIVPLIDTIGAGHFTYDESTATYTFELDDYLYNDYYFSFSILEALLGVGDPGIYLFGYMLRDSSSYSFDFHYLSISIDETTGLPSFTLNFTDYNSDTISLVTSFTDFGEVDMASSSDSDFAYAYSLLVS